MAKKALAAFFPTSLTSGFGTLTIAEGEPESNCGTKSYVTFSLVCQVFVETVPSDPMRSRRLLPKKIEMMAGGMCDDWPNADVRWRLTCVQDARIPCCQPVDNLTLHLNTIFFVYEPVQPQSLFLEYEDGKAQTTAAFSNHIAMATTIEKPQSQEHRIWEALQAKKCDTTNPASYGGALIVRDHDKQLSGNPDYNNRSDDDSFEDYEASDGKLLTSAASPVRDADP